MSGFPIVRPRRLRMTPALRSLAAETAIKKEKLIQPYFAVEGSKQVQEISTLPGIYRYSVDELVKQVEKDLKSGIKNHILFGLPEAKDERASGVSGKKSLIFRALSTLKKQFGDEVVLIPDLCLCAYTSHGHCGLLSSGGEILNDETNAVLARAAVSYAEAGADIIAPSDMMDGRVLAIRNALDAAGKKNTPIMSYSVKYASAFYGPFREAAHSAPASGDRKSHQMDIRNAREAVLEAYQDAAEGADILMVKPAMPYLDVIAELKKQMVLPLAAYQVSGEYAALAFAARAGAADLRAVALESLTAITRAGAEIILSYFTRQLHAEKWM
ncbi:MAG TPA: porphobilinogen synthase [Candidatus Hydrogenedentes bacterium]|nr:porphobilinogen synthase [Candidatus Hydrogenedentota bacterium]